MTEIEASKTVGQLVAERPSRARVFERLGIDFCCGGKIPLSDACTQRELDTDKIVAALREADANAADTDESDWTRATLRELIEHILEKHHAYLRGVSQGLLSRRHSDRAAGQFPRRAGSGHHV